MSALDVILLALLVLSAIVGYRRGAVLQAFGLMGLITGLVLGALIAPSAGRVATDPVARAALVMAVLLAGMAVGDVFGWLVGSRVKRRLRSDRSAFADALGGAALSVGALLLAVWFLGINLLQGPFPRIASEVRSSAIVRTLDEVLPAPPSLLQHIERAADLLGLPQAFAGLPSVPAPPVEGPPGSVWRAAASGAQPSTVEVLGEGCGAGVLTEGSGFVVATGYVVTNAHVVTGTSRQTVGHLGAVVVAFDPELDIAVLHVPGLADRALALDGREVTRGAGGAILGYPGGQLRTAAAAVRRVFDATGRDIYGHTEQTRRLYELQAIVNPGNSGGPFVLPSGEVAGVVFAASTIDPRIAYAIASPQVIPLVDRARTRTRPVDTGRCIRG